MAASEKDNKVALHAPHESGPDHCGAKRILTIDIGGTKLKASLVASDGTLAADPVRIDTPHPSPPPVVLAALERLIARFQDFDRISIGFPGVVRGTRIVTAPNLGTAEWAGVDIVREISQRTGVPTRVLNDAAVQGLGVVRGPGLETIITLGTGVGCAVYRNRRWLLHLELALDDFAGNAALKTLGLAAWNARIATVVRDVMRLTACERLYIGGGNARKIALQLPADVEIVSNVAGLTGGVRLWEEWFDEILAQSSI